MVFENCNTVWRFLRDRLLAELKKCEEVKDVFRPDEEQEVSEALCISSLFAGELKKKTTIFGDG